MARKITLGELASAAGWPVPQDRDPAELIETCTCISDEGNICLFVCLDAELFPVPPYQTAVAVFDPIA